MLVSCLSQSSRDLFPPFAKMGHIVFDVWLCVVDDCTISTQPPSFYHSVNSLWGTNHVLLMMHRINTASIILSFCPLQGIQPAVCSWWPHHIDTYKPCVVDDHTILTHTNHVLLMTAPCWHIQTIYSLWLHHIDTYKPCVVDDCTMLTHTNHM